jgi:hypothetical protein
MIIFVIPAVLLCLAAYYLFTMQEAGRRHRASLGIAITSMVICLFLAGVGTKGVMALYYLFNTGTLGIITAVSLLAVLPMAAFACIFAPALPDNGRRDRGMRILSFLSTGGWCALGLLAIALGARC